MSSSIEEYFEPPEWATKDDVIKAARHYINYWKIEAQHRNGQWLQAMEDIKRLKEDLRKASSENVGLRMDALQDPVLRDALRAVIMDKLKQDGIIPHERQG